MKLRLFAVLALACAAFAAAQDHDAVVDTTFTTEDGPAVRYPGKLNPPDLSGIEKAKALADERVPLGYGWKTLRTWAEGDLRPEPVRTPVSLRTEFVDLRFDLKTGPQVSSNFAEFMDYVHFAVKDRLGWDLGRPVVLRTAWDVDEYGERWGLPWWVPGEVMGDSIVVQPIPMITGRGIAMESLTRLYLELILREKTGDRLPYWFIYGATAFFAQEEWILKGQVEVIHEDLNIDQAAMVRDLELHRRLGLKGKASDVPGGTDRERVASRIAFWRAHELVEGIVVGESVRKFKQLIEDMEADPGLSFQSAVRQVYGMELDDLVARYEPRLKAEGN